MKLPAAALIRTVCRRITLVGVIFSNCIVEDPVINKECKA